MSASRPCARRLCTQQQGFALICVFCCETTGASRLGTHTEDDSDDEWTTVPDDEDEEDSENEASSLAECDEEEIDAISELIIELKQRE